MAVHLSNEILSEDVHRICLTPLPWEDLAGKLVLISGGSGFLGSYLVWSLMFLNMNGLLSKPVKVVVLSRNQEKSLRKFSQYLDNENFELIFVDINKTLELELQADYVIHAASQAGINHYYSDPVGTISANIFGTSELLKLAHKSSATNFMYISSGETYGTSTDLSPMLNEESHGALNPMAVRSCYAESKRMGEALCSAWHHQYGLHVTVARTFQTYGPYMNLDNGLVSADFISSILSGRDIVIKSDGSSIRTFLYVVDAITAFFTILLKGEAANAYNVGNSKAPISIAELANCLVEIYPEKKLKIFYENNQSAEIGLSKLIHSSVPNTMKLKKLGWEPNYTVEEGFKRTISSFLSE